MKPAPPEPHVYTPAGDYRMPPRVAKLAYDLEELLKDALDDDLEVGIAYGTVLSVVAHHLCHIFGETGAQKILRQYAKGLPAAAGAAAERRGRS